MEYDICRKLRTYPAPYLPPKTNLAVPIKAYLTQQDIYISHSTAQFTLRVAGSVQCIISSGHGSIAVETPAVTPAILIAAASPTAGAAGAGSIT